MHVKRFRGGLVFKAHRLLYHPTLGLRVMKKKKKKKKTVCMAGCKVELVPAGTSPVYSRCSTYNRCTGVPRS